MDKSLLDSFTNLPIGKDTAEPYFYEKTSSGPRYSRIPDFIRTDWENGFIPISETSSQFRELVHGFELLHSGRRSAQKLFLLQSEEGVDQSQDINLLENPHNIHTKDVVSASVIDQDKRQTYGEGGLIIRAPAGNIREMSHQDLGTDFSNPKGYLERTKDSRMFSTLDQIMLQAGHEEWTEITLEGESEEGKVVATGYFIKVDKHNNPVNPELANAIMTAAKNFNLPVKHVQEAGRTLDLKDEPAHLRRIIDFEPPICIRIVRDEKAYVLSVNNETNFCPFMITNTEGKSRSMIQSEAQRAITLAEQELSENDLKEVAPELEKLKGIISTLMTEIPELKIAPEPEQETMFPRKKIDTSEFEKFFKTIELKL